MDYEALGRYTAAYENAVKLQGERVGKIKKLADLLPTEYSSQNYVDVVTRDPQPARDALAELEEVERQLFAAAHEANRFAEVTGRPRFVFRQMKPSPR